MDPQTAKQSVVLLIEADPEAASASQALIQGLGAVCHCVSTLEDALWVLKQNVPDAVVVDYDLPDGTGIELIARLRQSFSHRGTPIILLTGNIHPQELERAVMLGMYAFLAKPFDPAELAKLVTAAVSEERVRR
ncbi:MAG: response regulator [Planctomycetes bacterium]|nr:response regulator [Planctomycetota bacterium]